MADVKNRKAYFVGGGVGSLCAAFYLIKDAGFEPKNITMIDDQKKMGGACDGSRSEEEFGFVCRGGRMLNFPTYECLWALLKQIPSLTAEGKTVFDEVKEFNRMIKTHCNSRVVDKNGVRLDVETMGLTQSYRIQMLKFYMRPANSFGDTRINEWFSDDFFYTKFWYMWYTTFAFQTWHSADELWRYMHRLLHEYVRIQTLEGVARTPRDQYTSIVLPVMTFLEKKGVVFQTGTVCHDVTTVEKDGKITATAFMTRSGDREETVSLGEGDLFFFQNGSMTDGAALGSWNTVPQLKPEDQTVSFTLWQKLADRHPGVFGTPTRFYKNSNESMWESFTVTTRNKALFDYFVGFQKNSPGTGALMTFKDSNWYLSIVIAYQPHFQGQDENTFIFWGYGLFPNKIGNYVAKRMMDCTGEEIFYELCQHCRVPKELIHDVQNIPCMMPYITSMFQPRNVGDRPTPVPKGCTNIGLISQFVEIPRDMVFTVEFSCRAGMMAVYYLCGIKKKIPKVTRHDMKLSIMTKAVIKSYRWGAGVEVERWRKSCVVTKALVCMGLVGLGAALGMKYLK